MSRGPNGEVYLEDYTYCTMLRLYVCEFILRYYISFQSVKLTELDDAFCHGEREFALKKVFPMREMVGDGDRSIVVPVEGVPGDIYLPDSQVAALLHTLLSASKFSDMAGYGVAKQLEYAGPQLRSEARRAVAATVGDDVIAKSRVTEKVVDAVLHTCFKFANVKKVAMSRKLR